MLLVTILAFLIRESMRDNEGIVRNGKLINIGLAIVMLCMYIPQSRTYIYIKRV